MRPAHADARGNIAYGNHGARSLDVDTRDWFGALYLLACSGAIVELWRRYSPAAEAPVTARTKPSSRRPLPSLPRQWWMYAAGRRPRLQPT